MRKHLSVVLAIIMAMSVLAPCQSVIAAEIRMNDAVAVSGDIAQMSEEYNTEYEEILDDTGAESVSVDNRIIVETRSKINTYDAVDEVYGLGYAFIQFEDSESADKALEQYEKQGLTAENDKVYNLNADINNGTSAYASDSSKWAYTFSESDITLNYLKKQKLSDITVGVIDSGVEFTHPLLKSRIIRTNVNFSNSGGNNSEFDDEGHGTSCAGIIAQCTPDNVKIAGFKAGSKDGNVYASSLICTYEYILNMNDKPDVLNMSFGGYGEPLAIETQLLNELKESGISLFASAGNENLDTADSTPANDENVFAVSAYDQRGNKCWFSNYGTTVDMAAPGVNVYTSDLNGSYTQSFTGTSAAAPFVSAAAAIVLSQNDTLSPDEVYQKLKDSAFNTNRPADRIWAGAGLLNFSNLIVDANRKSAVAFNYESGEYEDTIKVELSCADRLNTKIIYTTDGTLPSSSNGTTYKNAIEVDSKANIIAAAFPIIGSTLHSQYVSANYQIFKNAQESDFDITEEGEITAYNGKYAAIKVPDTINGIIPVSVGDNCFKNSDIVHIEFPDTVEIFKNSVFENSNLQRIKAVGVKECWVSTFKNCSALYDENMPNIEYISDAAFCNCSMLTNPSFAESLTDAHSFGYVDGTGSFFGTGITEANFPKLRNCSRAFENTPIKSANLPKVDRLMGAFKDCKQLTEINIPLVTVVGTRAFANCVSLPKEMDFSQIEEVEAGGFEDSLFENLDLPNCTETWGRGFVNASAKTINLPNCKIISGSDFAGDKLEYVNIENVEKVFSTSNPVFINCFSLKYIYAPKADKVPSIVFDERGIQEIKNGKVPALEYIYAPKATEFNYICDLSECLNMKFIYLPSLETLESHGDPYFPKNDDFTLYFSESFKAGDILDSHVYGKYTVVAPKGSYAEQWAHREWYYYRDGLNFIPSNTRDDSIENPANVTDLGRSICTSVAGLRFGFTWDNIDEIESLASDIKYGFIYSQKGAENLSIDTVDGKIIKKAVANNRIDHGDTTSFNLVISNIPKQYYDREITARAYVCIDGMYFYSNILKGSFGEVAGLVLADDEIDQNTKNAVNKLLEA
ncbi:MAG TPA: hypothetical protein DCZ02_04335 [Ruminococcaceae bacterium]|nr:hypothetical protein [Oscillospiraceae bacterium]